MAVEASYGKTKIINSNIRKTGKQTEEHLYHSCEEDMIVRLHDSPM